MPIYAKSVRLLMKDMADAFALQDGQSFTRQQAIDWFAQNYPKIKPGTVHCHLIRFSTNTPTRDVIKGSGVFLGSGKGSVATKTPAPLSPTERRWMNCAGLGHRNRSPWRRNQDRIWIWLSESTLKPPWSAI